MRAHRCTDLSPLSVSDTFRHICTDSPAVGHCLRLRSSDYLADESRRHERADLCADNVANPVSDFVADCSADLQSLG